MIKKILNNSFLYFISTALIKFAMLILSIIIARFSGKEVFGQYMTIRSTVATIEMIALMGMNQTSIKFISENNHNDKSKLESTFNSIFLILLISSFCFSMIIFLFPEKLSIIFFNSNNQIFINAVKYSSFLLFFSILSVILTSILNGFERYKNLSLTNIYSILIFILPAVYFVYNYNLNGAVIGVTIFFALSSSFKLYMLKKHMNYIGIDFNMTIKKERIISLLKFTIPTFFSIIMIMPIFWYSKTILISNTGSFNEMAMFEASYQWLTIVLVATGAVTNISIPIFSKLLKKNQSRELKKALFINLLINIIISIVFCFVFIIFSDSLLLLYGEDYQNTQLLVTLLISSVPFAAQAIINRFFISISKEWYNFYLSVLWSIFYLSYIFRNISTISALTLAEAFLYSYIFLFFISIVIVLKQFYSEKV